MNDVITLCFPAKFDYIAPIRLAVSGIVSNREMSVEQLENIKTCVSEACMLLICSQTCNVFHVTVTIKDAEIIVSVDGSKTEKIVQCKGCMEFNTEMSKMMINAMSSECRFVGEGDALSKVIFSILTKD